jgi:hypothetical protein
MDAAALRKLLVFFVLGMTARSTLSVAAPLVLHCKITEGAQIPSVTILVDEAESIVVYGGARSQIGGSSGALIDLSMKITLRDDRVIVANDTRGAIVITKHDGKFVHSFVTAIPLPNGNYGMLGNTIWGECTKSPFH